MMKAVVETTADCLRTSGQPAGQTEGLTDPSCQAEDTTLGWLLVAIEEIQWGTVEFGRTLAPSVGVTISIPVPPIKSVSCVQGSGVRGLRTDGRVVAR